MTDAAPAFFQAIEASAFAAAIRQSPYAYMLANVAHILSLMVFFGAVAVMDLRIAGAFSSIAPGGLLRRARGIAILGFLGMIASGTLLFVAEASHVILNPLFQIKLALIALAALNFLLFEIFIARAVNDLPAFRPMPASARLAGLASLAIWLAVAACGRLIAYF